MKLEYTINESDFLDYQLYTASKSERINRKRRNGQILLTVGFAILALIFYMNTKVVLAIYFGIFSLATAIFYPRYFKRRYKKHYQGYIKEYYSKRFGQAVLTEIQDDLIYSRDHVGEGNIKMEEIEEVNETAKHFFLKVSTGQSLIIPKGTTVNPDEVRARFQALGLKINDEQAWKWD